MYRTEYVTISDIYRPIRWMALECLTSEKPRFTLKSDVWSYGIVLWEIFTLGSYPYEEFDNWDLSKHLQNGYRLHKPLNCPAMVYLLMTECWSVRAEQRPSLEEVRRQLNHTLDEIVNESNGDTELAHSAINNAFNYASLAERFIQSRFHNGEPNRRDSDNIYSQSRSSFLSSSTLSTQRLSCTSNLMQSL